jgi:RNA polymerase sigma factor (sigma-70 family)
MSADDSLTDWINRLQDGDEQAARRVWNYYCERLLALAKVRLAASRKGPADEEDVLVSTFETLFRRAKRGQFAWVSDRDDLWRLLVTIVDRKAINVLRKEQRLKRGGGGEAGDTAVIGTADSRVEAPALEPTPEFAAMFAESVERLLALLDDDELRRIALLRLDGYANAEIAGLIGKSLPTVERRLRLIRSRWEHWN